MFWILNFLKKRPSDKTIMIAKIIFWLLISISAYYSLIYGNTQIETSLFFGNLILSDNWVFITKYIIVALWLIPIIMWSTNICLLKSKYMRYIQVFFWIILLYISNIIISTANLWVETLYWILWIFPVFAWITWKCITTKCLRYKQKITKIRI